MLTKEYQYVFNVHVSVMQNTVVLITIDMWQEVIASPIWSPLPSHPILVYLDIDCQNYTVVIDID